MIEYINGANLNLLLTYKCNYLCNHCISSCGPKREETMSFNQAKDYIDNTLSVIEVGNVGYTGGEPFLYYDLLKHLMDYTYNKYGIPGGVVTNSFWAVSKEIVKEKLDELYKCGLRSMVISCDSYHLKYVSVEAIRHVVHKALELGIPICINTIVTKNTKICKNDIPGLLSLSKADIENNVTIKEIGPLRIGRALTHISAENLIDTDNESYFNGSCPYVINTPTITPNGSVYACCCFGDAQKDPEKLIGYCGNIHKDTFENVLGAMKSNLLFNIIANYGPYSLLKTITETEKDIPLRGRYLSTCDICVELYHNPRVRSALGKLLESLVSNVSV